MNIIKTRKNNKDIVQFNGREYNSTVSFVWDKYMYIITPSICEYLFLDYNNKLVNQHISSFKKHNGSGVLAKFIIHGNKEGVEIEY